MLVFFDPHGTTHVWTAPGDSGNRDARRDSTRENGTEHKFDGNLVNLAHTPHIMPLPQTTYQALRTP